MPEVIVPPPPPEAASPTGQLYGLSALYNRLPAKAQEAIGYAGLAAGALVALDRASPGLLPQALIGYALAVAAVLGPLGLFSAGSRA